jgi:hypothetical protein
MRLNYRKKLFHKENPLLNCSTTFKGREKILRKGLYEAV